MSIAAYKAETNLVAGRKMLPLTDFFTLGEQNYVAQVVDEEHVVGNIVVTRQGRIVRSLLTFGMTFDSPDELETLMRPIMSESKTKK